MRGLRAVGSLLDRVMDWVLWGLGKLMPVLRPLGRLFLYIARLLRLNRVLSWEDLLLVSKPYWTGDSRNKALRLLFATLFCMVANAKAAYYFGYQLKLINDIVNMHGTDIDFYWSVGKLFGIGFLWALLNSAYGTFRTYLAIDWRCWMATMNMRQYVKNEAYLRVKIDNADQRLAQDPDVFANTTVWLAIIIVETLVNLWTFTPVLWEGSKLLMACCIGCAFASYVAVLWMGRSLPSLTYQQYDSEATLRTHLGDGPRYSRAIALQRIEPLFLAQAETRLGNVRAVLVRIMRINLFIGVYNFVAGQVVGNAALVGIGWLVMHGRATMGAIAQAGQAFTNVYQGLTVFTSQYGAYSTLKAEISRLGPFSRALAEIGENKMPAGDWIEYAETDGSTIKMDNVTVLSSYLEPKPVVKDMTVAFDVDTLITGRDGHGKTDLACALGLGASQGKGKITRPARNKIMFLTQTPYLPICTLREFLSDMRPDTAGDDQRLATVLDLVGLHDIIEHSRGETTGGLDTTQDWKAKISSTEQLQLCMARAILFKPSVLVIDQATDGMEPELEEDIYKVLRGLGLRLITFSNNSRLSKSFKRVLEMREDRGFDQHDATEYKGPSWKAVLKRFGLNGSTELRWEGERQSK
jgi:vitamin B12/bleomycin/antimicrobial peptide transport system ATP-binding/permease protein